MGRRSAGEASQRPAGPGVEPASVDGARHGRAPGRGYVLRVDPDTVDTSRLDRLVQAGRDAVGARRPHRRRRAVPSRRDAGARRAARRPGRSLVRAGCCGAPAGAGAGRRGGPRRCRVGDRSPRRGADEAARPDRRAPGARAVPGPADRGAVSGRSPGRCADRVPRRRGITCSTSWASIRDRSCRRSSGRCWRRIRPSMRRSLSSRPRSCSRRCPSP